MRGRSGLKPGPPSADETDVWCPLLTLLLAASMADGREELSPPDPRVEAFLLERPTDAGPEPVAVVFLRALDGPGGLLLEQEVTFRAGGVTILQAESREPDGWHFVRRELRGPDSPGRSFSGQPDGAGGMRLLRWGASVPVHESWPAPAPRLPLELLESMRFGRETRGPVPFYDPVAEAVVELDVHRGAGDPRAAASPEPDPNPNPADPDLRWAELRGAEGRLVGRYVFRGRELVAFQWQDGARWARRVDPAEARRSAAKWRRDHDPVSDVWAAVRAGHVRRR